MLQFKSFKQISEQSKRLESFFEQKIEYLAHTNQHKKSETLHEHILKVTQYFNRLIEVHKLEGIVNKLIEGVALEKTDIAEYVKTLFLHSIVFHDFGKINDNFQVEKMKNELFKQKTDIKIGSEHSFLSAYFLLNYHLDAIYKNPTFSNSEKNILWIFSFLFTIPILKHHSGWINKDYKHEEEKINSIHRFLQIIDFAIPKEFTNQFIKNEEKLWAFFDDYTKTKDFNFFNLFALLKLNWSLLTASDYYATSEYMNDLEFRSEEDFGILTKTLKQSIINNFAQNKEKSFNSKLVNNTDYYYDYPFEQLQNPSNINLNILRQKLGAEVINGIEKNKNEKIYYIEAPTGGGKTNMSMIAIYKLLQLHEEINKIFYVFPFTTLITQTNKAIRETFGLVDTQIAQVHSKAGFQIKENDDNDAKYGNDLRNQIDNIFVNYPITLLTHIKFFDILKSNDKQSNYILHRLANSVVIIDELQAYNPVHWDKLKYYISNYAKLFNIRFIIMSATLPKISNIAIGENETLKFHHLIENAQKNYLQNPNFSQRVSIKTELLGSKDIQLSELAEFAYKKSENYAETRVDEFKGSIYTIIEFIFKKSATEFYDYIIKNNLFKGYIIFVLSGTIIEPQRKFIINFLKDKNNRNKKVLLITTQVVEAGVDIDMDLGFKNQSLIDSDEQLAGRINRNVNKKNCELYLFRINEPKTIYGKDLRYKIARNFSNIEITNILQKKDFDFLYNKVMIEIGKDNDSAYKEGFNEYKAYFKSLNFDQINKKFKLIENETASIFIPAEIDIINYEFVDTETKEITIENNFSDGELDFIKKNDCFVASQKVSGEKVWGLYLSIIQNKQMDIAKKGIGLKILNGIMSKFVFSVYINKIDDMKEYFEYNEENHDFKFMQYYKLYEKNIGKNRIYNLESGLNETIMKKTFDFI